MGNASSSNAVKALLAGDPEALKGLLQERPALATKPLDKATGDACLHMVARAGQAAMVQPVVAVAGKAALALRNSAGATPLMVAVKFLQPACVKELLQAGAEVLDVDGQGRTPLHHAALCGDSGTINMLLDAAQARGGRPMLDCLLEVRDTQGLTAIRHAESHGRVRAVDLITRRMHADHDAAALAAAEAGGVLDIDALGDSGPQRSSRSLPTVGGLPAAMWGATGPRAPLGRMALGDSFTTTPRLASSPSVRFAGAAADEQASGACKRPRPSPASGPSFGRRQASMSRRQPSLLRMGSTAAAGAGGPGAPSSLATPGAGAPALTIGERPLLERQQSKAALLACSQSARQLHVAPLSATHTAAQPSSVAEPMSSDNACPSHDQATQLRGTTSHDVRSVAAQLRHQELESASHALSEVSLAPS